MDCRIVPIKSGTGPRQRQIWFLKMPARLFLSSGDLVADRRFEFARDLQLKGDLVAAADLLLQATELAPGFVSAWFSLGEIREQLGERDAAIAAFRKALIADPEDRHGACLRLMLLRAEKLSAMPEGYVRALFDQYAPKFEKALVDDLGYRGPALLFKAVLAAGGLVAFTVETHDGDGIILGEGLRYAHSTGYVRGSIGDAGLTLSRCEDLSARNEDNVPVPGLVAVAAKP